MKTKLCAAVLLVLTVGLGIGLTWGGSAPPDGPRPAPGPAPAAGPTTDAFLFGKSIPKKLRPGEEPGFGIQASHIEWWLGDPDGKNLRQLDNPRTGRIRVRPLDQTVVLKRDDASLTLLGPLGEDLRLSLKDGPLARTPLNDQFITTFAFTPGGKAVTYVDGKGALCRIQLATKELTRLGVTGLNPSQGVHFSPDGSRIVYSKYFRANDFVPVVFSVYVASADGTGEKKLTEYEDGKQLGFGWLPDGRVGVVGPTMVRAIDPKTGKAETVAGPWTEPLNGRAFGGFSPDGSTFIFDVGGPYDLRLLRFAMKTLKVAPVGPQYLESFQRMIWVRVASDKR